MAKKVAVIDYGMGNLRSVLNAWRVAGADARLVEKPSEVAEDDVIVFPGQGAMADAMKLLKKTGFDSAIKDWIGEGRAFFGICLGMQALFEYSEEGGGVGALGVFRGTVRKMSLPQGVKIPHMGWNDVEFSNRAELLKGIDPANDQFYFVHSYYVDTPEKPIIWGTTSYGGLRFTSAVSNGRLAATQFHPEKSQTKGLQLYGNFLEFIG